MTASVRSALPRWARVADVATLALVGMGGLVALFGGARFAALGLRLSLTQPWRLFALAVLIAAVRHGLVRHPMLHERMAQVWRDRRRSPALTAAWRVLISTRLAVLAVGFFAVLTIGYATVPQPNRVSPNELLNLASRWDAGWYHGIATYGYSWDPEAGPEVQQNIVFFPAYPMLTRAVGRLMDSQMMAAGVVVSLAAFFVGLVYFYRLARFWLTEDESVTALWLLGTYPFALFFGAVYTESLYLCGAVAALFHFHRRELVKAGAWGLVVGLTRPNGCFLSIPLGLLAVAQGLADDPRSSRWVGLICGPGESWRPAAGSVAGGRGPWLVRALASAAMPGIGMLGYSAFVYSLTGAPFAWVKGHEAWGREYSVAPLVASVQALVHLGPYEAVHRNPFEFINAAPALLALGLTGVVFRRFGGAYVLFILLNLLPPLFAGGFLSVGRLTAVLFPMFLALSTLLPPQRRTAWIAAFAMGQAFNACLFFTWRTLF